jgi:PAS domain S-box-containing protein
LYLGIKKQQKKLVASAEEYRRLFELNPNPMWVYDTETFRFIKVNEAAIELYGYSMGEFLSMTIKDIRPPNDNERLVEYVRSLRKGIRQAGIWKHLKKSGEMLYVSIASHHMQFDKRPCSLVMINNVTEAVINEEKMKAQNIALQEIAWSNSHEVRHSLCSIISLTDLLKDSKDEAEKRECLALLQLCTAELDEVLKKIGKKVDALEKV